MHLTNLIDLIAEVAAKRASKEGKQEEDTPDAVILFWQKTWAGRCRVRHTLTRFFGFGQVQDRVDGSRKTTGL